MIIILGLLIIAGIIFFIAGPAGAAIGLNARKKQVAKQIANGTAPVPVTKRQVREQSQAQAWLDKNQAKLEAYEAKQQAKAAKKRR